MLALVSCTTGGIASLPWENDTYFQKRYTPTIAMVTFATAAIAGQCLFVLPENENPAGRRRRSFQY